MIDAIRIGVTGVNAMPFRAHSLEQRLVGKAMSGPALRAFCKEIEEAAPLEDLHASAEYRKEVAGVLVRRALASVAQGGVQA